MSLYLLLVLEGPLMAFGATAVDAYRPTDRWPGASLLTGLIGNALGVRRTEPDRLEAIQSRLAFACRLDRAGEALRDFHTAQLGAGDKAWTTRGAPEGRAGGAATYDSPHIRYMDYRADARIGVALRLKAGGELTTEHVRYALRAPARPLFVGRKACPPAGPILRGEAEATHAVEALASLPIGDDGSTTPPVLIADPAVPEDCIGAARRVRRADQRRWRSGFHTGEVTYIEGEWQGALS